ncbi:clotting factor B [Eurytemora carolleeae]|uniref:clotting factor B n=1 Tax=Eurytemora carolleeae TaxID=1294199 RepID=UPI000C78E291|nr:clotting factor B [Eurytemora carolleeae]|eukprot:XP_023323236.1 clotting factor B-like [Eurytemora affinis]
MKIIFLLGLILLPILQAGSIQHRHLVDLLEIQKYMLNLICPGVGLRMCTPQDDEYKSLEEESNITMFRQVKDESHTSTDESVNDDLYTKSVGSDDSAKNDSVTHDSAMDGSGSDDAATNDTTAFNSTTNDSAEFNSGSDESSDKGRIVGGSSVEKGNYPFMASLRYRVAGYNRPPRYQHYCGGAIITERTIVTAAHCVLEANLKDLVISVGDHDLRDTADEEIIVKASRIIIHPRYNYYNFDNDIAVVHLEERIMSGPHLSKINLMSTEYNLEKVPDVKLTVMGWGALSEGGPTPFLLTAVQVPYVRIEHCRQHMSPYMISEGMFCAGDIYDGGVDSCQGDSGGPIVYSVEDYSIKASKRKMFLNLDMFGKGKEEERKEDENEEIVKEEEEEEMIEDSLEVEKEYVLAGLVSWGYSYAEPGYAGVYNNISYFLGICSSCSSQLDCAEPGYAEVYNNISYILGICSSWAGQLEGICSSWAANAEPGYAGVYTNVAYFLGICSSWAGHLGVGCAAPGYAGVYTDIAYFLGICSSWTGQLGGRLC